MKQLSARRLHLCAIFCKLICLTNVRTLLVVIFIGERAGNAPYFAKTESCGILFYGRGNPPNLQVVWVSRRDGHCTIRPSFSSM